MQELLLTVPPQFGRLRNMTEKMVPAAPSCAQYRIGYALSGRTLTLNEFCSALWTDDSPAAAEMRGEVRRDARILSQGLDAMISIHLYSGRMLESVFWTR